MRKRSNFRTTFTSCLLSVLVTLSGAISQVQANASVPTDGEYVCMTGEPLAGSDTSPTYTINNGVTLSGGSCVGAVVIPEGATSIGYGSFAEQSGLTLITIPASVTSIGDYAFFFAESLMDVNFSGDAPTNVGEGAFSGTASGARANISATATGFGTDATWNGLVIVRAVSVPANGQYVCTTGVLRTGDDTSPTYTIDNGVITWGGNCAGAVLIPAGVTAIGESAFEGATALTSINIPASVTSIGQRGLREVGLTSIIFAQGGQLTTIEEGAFSFATSLTTITIPAGVTSIGDDAFYKATSLNSINIPSSVTSIGNKAFQGIIPLAQINVDPNNQTYSSIDGVLFNEGATTLIQYPSGKTEITHTVPASVTSIGEYAFAFTTALNSITFAQGSQLTSIDQYAFYSATALTSVTIPAGVTTIGSSAFENTPALSSFIFAQGSQLTTIEEGAFYEATALTSITIPASVDTIEGWAFEDSALIDFNFLGNAPTYADEDAFAGMSSGATAHIKASATGFGAPGTSWNGLVVQADLKEVTYNSAGGTPVTPTLFTQSESIQTAPVSTRADYTLAGWSVTDNGSVVTFPYTPTADITLHAIWTPTATPPSPQAPPANLTKMAEEARARVVEEAKTEIKSVLSSGMPLTAEQLLKADFKGVTTKNIDLVNSDIAKLPSADKTDLKQIEKVVLKFAIVDKIANGKAFPPSELIAVGLVPEDSKIKSSITSALKKLPGSSLDTFEKIQAAVASVEKKHADRKARLATVLGKKR